MNARDSEYFGNSTLPATNLVVPSPEQIMASIRLRKIWYGIYFRTFFSLTESIKEIKLLTKNSLQYQGGHGNVLVQFFRDNVG